MSGICASPSVKSVSGGITLDGVTGAVDADTVSGAVEAQGIDGKLDFNTVSGDLTLADGWLETLDVNGVSGDVTADLDLDPGRRCRSPRCPARWCSGSRPKPTPG